MTKTKANSEGMNRVISQWRRDFLLGIWDHGQSGLLNCGWVITGLLQHCSFVCQRVFGRFSNSLSLGFLLCPQSRGWFNHSLDSLCMPKRVPDPNSGDPKCGTTPKHLKTQLNRRLVCGTETYAGIHKIMLQKLKSTCEITFTFALWDSVGDIYI